MIHWTVASSNLKVNYIMQMEADFINAYLEQLNKTLHDQSSEIVLLKTKLAVTEKLTASLQAELQETKMSLENTPKKTKPSDNF